MKLKTLGLLMASAIGMNVSALEVGGRLEIDTGSTSAPTVLTDDYYTNTFGETYSLNGSHLELIYDLNDAVLININGDQALGYVSSTNFASGNYFLCDINECNDVSKRTYIPGVDYLAGETVPYARSTQNMISGHGHTLVTGRVSNNDQFKSAIVDNNGIVLDSFTSTGWQWKYLEYRSNYPVGTTGITQEENFKLLTASYTENIVRFKAWDAESSQLHDYPIKDMQNVELNSLYPNGLIPIVIDNPKSNEEGEILYTVVLGGMSSDSNIDSILWGDVKVLNGEVIFNSEIKSVMLPSGLSVLFGGLDYANPMIDGNSFTLRDYSIDLSGDEATALTINVNTDDELLLNPFIYKRSDSGAVVLYETDVSYKIYQDWVIGLAANQLNIDPYLDPSINITLSTGYENFFGAEVSCYLQTTNATVDNNDYIGLSPTGLQVPIEWDSATGEWKGAQSLTGTDSLSGSHDFAQFDLTADVTTGTWTMSCSGFGSDILGNKLIIQPTDITLNLDDQIHGGSGVISGSVDLSNHADYSGVVVTITFENGRHIEVTPDENGDFNFDRLVEGEFEVHVYNEQYVAGCNTVQVTNTNTNQPLNIIMVAGDINGDDAVDIGDYSYMSSMYGLTAADEGFDAVADLNQDDVINVQDLSILGSHFGTDQCEAPLPQ